MAILSYNELVSYATPPNNYIGTTIFLSYIILALYATLSITYSLYTQYTTTFHASPPPKDKHLGFEAAKAARKRHIKIYAFLASISFATLSYHMLFFLITHYFTWTGQATWDFSTVSGEKVGKWMLDSALFQDFARELVQAPTTTVWTQIAVLETWFWNLWIGRKAREHRLDTGTMWKFVVLSQILPVSFTACLFIIQLHISAQRQPNSPSRLNKIRKLLASPVLPTILLNLTLLSLPSFRTHAIFIPLVLFSRFILLLPHLDVLRLSEREVKKCAVVTVGFVVAFHVLGRKELWVRSGREWKRGLRGLREGGYAVRALGWDALVGAGVAGAVGWGGGV